MYTDGKIWLGQSADKNIYLLPQMANRHGLISGASNGGQTYLEPQGSATREQVATILMEFCKNVKK